MLDQGRQKNTLLQYWLIGLLISMMLLLTSAAFFVISITSNSQNTNVRGSFESTLWAALQLQVQHYRMMNFVVTITPENLPLEGIAFSEYDQLMSRVDLLREGEVNSLIRLFEDGRSMRLLYLINGELELLSLHIAQLEVGDLSQKTLLKQKLAQLEAQINEFIILINQGSNHYAVSQRLSFEEDLNRIAWLMWGLLGNILLIALGVSSVLFTTHKRQLNSTDLNTKLTSLTKSKMRFLSVLNHEVRTPINGIIGLSNILKKSSLTDKQKRMVGTIQDAGDTLLHSLNVFSDLSKMEAGQLDLNFTHGDLNQHLEQTCDRLCASLSHGKAHLYAYIDWTLPQTCVSDFTRLRQIFSALLENAFQYSAEGNICIVVRSAPLQNDSWRPQIGVPLDATMMQISVRDAGVGLSEEQQKTILTGFEFLDTNDERKYLAGLNLSMCHQLAKSMGGQLQFTSQHGIGSEFWLDIPLYFEADSLSIADQKSAVGSISVLHAKTVLIIEEDEHCAHLMRMQVASLGMVPVLSADRLIGPLTMQVDVVLISHDKNLDSVSYQQLTQLAANGSLILAAQLDSREATLALTAHYFHFPLTQLKLAKLLVKHFEQQTATQLPRLLEQRQKRRYQ